MKRGYRILLTAGIACLLMTGQAFAADKKAEAPPADAPVAAQMPDIEAPPQEYKPKEPMAPPSAEIPRPGMEAPVTERPPEEKVEGRPPPTGGSVTKADLQISKQDEGKKEEKKAEAKKDDKAPAVDPCAAYMASYSAYNACQDREQKMQRAKDAKEKRGKK